MRRDLSYDLIMNHLNVFFSQVACSPEEQIKSTARFGSEWFSSARPNSASLLTLITWRWLIASP